MQRLESRQMRQRINPAAEVQAHMLRDDGTFPNNPSLPIILYRRVCKLPNNGHAATILERVFAANGWCHSWRNGIYNFQHYHSTAHEVLGCFSGQAQTQLGGPHGVLFTLRRGDVLVLPAGTAHKRTRASSDFTVVGCYPDGQHYDMKYGRAGERPSADENIARVPLPPADPIFGASGPLIEHWHTAQAQSG